MPFDTTFAFSQAKHHGPALVAFALAMAVGLEICKPFAVEATLACLRSWAFGRALAMAMLSTVAIGYSLTAELSLTATMRGDAAAARTKATATTDDDRAELARLTKARELMAFTSATEEAVVTAREAVAAAERTRNAECGNGRGTNCRNREADETTARVTLAKAIADRAATDRATRLEEEVAAVRQRLAKGTAVASADPGATALAAYLATMFGLAIPASLLSEWLVLVAVIALELGSALAVALVRAVAGEGAPRIVEQAVDTPAWTPDEAPAAPAPRTVQGKAPAVEQGRRASQRGQRLGASASVSKEDAARGIVDALTGAGGRLEGGTVRRLAALIGGKRSTVHNALAALVSAGIVARAGAELVLRG